MPPTSPFSIHELLIERLALLRALADSLSQAQVALAQTTPQELNQHTARQQELCRQLRSLATGIPGGAPSRMHAGLADDLQLVTRRVGDLNHKYAALLRRWRRTVDIFCRVLASSGTTYPAPKQYFRPDVEGTRSKG